MKTLVPAIILIMVNCIGIAIYGFSNKRSLSVIRARIEGLETEQKEIKQKTCNHINVEFVEGTRYGWPIYMAREYKKICRDCGKTLIIYGSEKEYLEDRLKNYDSIDEKEMARK